MTDNLTPAARSAAMRAVRSANTKPEILVRKLLHRLGYRFRLHVARLPGKPDIVLKRHRLVLFVHGCFWHQHAECRRAALPSTNKEFWTEKLQRNVSRDAAKEELLRNAGWQVGVIWECQTKDAERLASALRSIMTPQ